MGNYSNEIKIMKTYLLVTVGVFLLAFLGGIVASNPTADQPSFGMIIACALTILSGLGSIVMFGIFLDFKLRD
jgi:hypothetical protein